MLMAEYVQAFCGDSFTAAAAAVSADSTAAVNDCRSSSFTVARQLGSASEFTAGRLQDDDVQARCAYMSTSMVHNR